MSQTFLDLLTDLHHSLERLADDLSRDQPALAKALRKESAWIPRPEDVQPKGVPLSATRPRTQPLRPLLYRALDAGLVSPRRFDALMLRNLRAQRVRRRA